MSDILCLPFGLPERFGSDVRSKPFLCKIFRDGLALFHAVQRAVATWSPREMLRVRRRDQVATARCTAWRVAFHFGCGSTALRLCNLADRLF
jgi:hypothetical protein